MSLEEDQEILKDYTVSVLLEKEEVEKDMSTLRDRHYEELDRAKENRLMLINIESEISRLQRRFSDAERFILALVDLGLDPLILREAVSGVLKEGQPGEDALVDAIQKTARLRDQSLSKGFFATDGPRTADHYLSALDLTINARKELKEKAKVAQFWKMVAKSDPSNANTVTPSTSKLDQIEKSGHLSCPSNASLVDDLVNQFKEALVRKSPRVEDPTLPCPTGRAIKDNLAKGSTMIDGLDDLACSPQLMVQERGKPEQLDQPGRSCIPKQTPTSREKQRFAFSDLHSAFEPESHGDLILPNNMQSLSDAARRLSDPNLSLKAMAKDDIRPIRASHTCDLSSNSFLSTSTPTLAQRKRANRMSYPFAASPSTISYNRQINSSLGSTDDPSNGTLRACQALLSLERICAAFSTSSLGSVDTAEGGVAVPQPWFTDSNSTNTTDGLESNTSTSSKLTVEDSIPAVPSGIKDDGIEINGSGIRRDIMLCANDAQDGNENTTSPPVVPPPNHAPPRKTVKWASPLFPGRDRSNSLASASSSSSFYSSSAGSNTSSTSGVRPFVYSKVRTRSDSSPTPIPTKTRKSTIQSATTTLSKSSQILKPKPALVIRTAPKVSSPTKAKSRYTQTPIAKVSSQPNPPATARGTEPPAVPPRSPLRPSSQDEYWSPSLSLTLGSPEHSTTSPRREGDLKNGQVSVQPHNPSSIKPFVLRRPPLPPTTKVYDYTTPVLPLKVVKKNSSKLSDTSPSLNVAANLPPAQATDTDRIAAKQVSSAASPASPLIPPPRRPRLDSTKSSLKVDPSFPPAPQDSFICFDSCTSSANTTSNSCFDASTETQSSIATPGTSPNMSDTNPTSFYSRDPSSPSPAAPMDGKKCVLDTMSPIPGPKPRLGSAAGGGLPSGTHVVPPIRSSSLQPPRTMQPPPRRPQLGPLHPLRPRGVMLPKVTTRVPLGSALPPTPQASPTKAIEKDGGGGKRWNVATGRKKEDGEVASPGTTSRPGDRTSDPTGLESLKIPKLKQPKQDCNASPFQQAQERAPSVMISPPNTPKPAPAAHIRLDTSNTSPLAKLRMTMLPPASLVRSFSASKQFMSTHGKGVGLGLGVQGTALKNAGGITCAVGEQLSVGPHGNGVRSKILQASKALKQVEVMDGPRRRPGSRRGVFGNLSPRLR